MEAVRLAVSGFLHQSKSPAKAFVHRRAWSLATVEERMHPRDELDQSLDYIFIDETGQVSTPMVRELGE